MTRHEVGFTAALVVLVSLSVLPPVLDWSNRIDPRVLGVSFAIVWQLSLVALMSLTLIAWYVVDDRAGNLDVGADTPVDGDPS